MKKEMNQTIEVTAKVAVPVQKAWELWTSPEHIIRWNAASEDWHTTKAQNDLRKGGKFSSRMEAKDGSFGFDFEGTYDDVIIHQLIEYTMSDGRKVSIKFTEKEGDTYLQEVFEPENEHSSELQRQGWQAIMDNFKRYAETQK
jgi:uncharacterized protein YndB with AHSA1/START domain